MKKITFLFAALLFLCGCAVTNTDKSNLKNNNETLTSTYEVMSVFNYDNYSHVILADGTPKGIIEVDIPIDVWKDYKTGDVLSVNYQIKKSCSDDLVNCTEKIEILALELSEEVKDVVYNEPYRITDLIVYEPTKIILEASPKEGSDMAFEPIVLENGAEIQSFLEKLDLIDIYLDLAGTQNCNSSTIFYVTFLNDDEMAVSFVDCGTLSVFYQTKIVDLPLTSHFNYVDAEITYADVVAEYFKVAPGDR